jgi:hypothetical protein
MGAALPVECLSASELRRAPPGKGWRPPVCLSDGPHRTVQGVVLEVPAVLLVGLDPPALRFFLRDLAVPPDVVPLLAPPAVLVSPIAPMEPLLGPVVPVPAPPEVPLPVSPEWPLLAPERLLAPVDPGPMLPVVPVDPVVPVPGLVVPVVGEPVAEPAAAPPVRAPAVPEPGVPVEPVPEPGELEPAAVPPADCAFAIPKLAIVPTNIKVNIVFVMERPFVKNHSSVITQNRP